MRLKWLTSRLTDERAIVLPATMTLLLVVTTLGTVAAQSGIVSSHQTLRDSNIKRAVAATSSGFKGAMYSTNLAQPADDECVTRDAGGTLAATAVDGNGWCPAAFTEDLGDNASFSAWVSESTDIVQGSETIARRKIVSTGTVNGVVRRVAAYVTSATGAPLFGSGAAIRTTDPINFENDAQVNGSIESNGAINLKNSVEVCGNATPGPGQTVTLIDSAHLCEGYATTPATQTFSFPQVDQGNAPTVNDNDRIGNEDVWAPIDGSSYNAATRDLVIKNNATLTLDGDVYSFCRLTIQNNAQLKVAARAPGTALRIYIDSPEHCGGSGWGGIDIKNNAELINLNSTPTALQIYVAGSSSIATTVSLQNNTASNLLMVIIAPNSTVSLQNGVHIRGAIQAQKITMQNSTEITWDGEAGTISSASVFRIYHRQEWIDCTATNGGSLPDSGC